MRAAPAADVAASQPPAKLLGDHVESALSTVGITKERVAAWLGSECGCSERQEKMNALDKWARAAVGAGVEKAKGWLASIIGAKNKPVPAAADQAAAGPEFPIRFDETNLAVGFSGKRFNASLAAWRDGYALAWRSGWAGSNIVVSLLDRDFRTVRGQHFPLALTHAAASYGREDPVLFRFRDQLHVAYVGVTRTGRRRRAVHTNILYASLRDNLTVERIFYPQIPNRAAWEKNHAYFEHAGHLYAVYSINPHRIIKIDGDRAEWAHETAWEPGWSGGEMRGGTVLRVENEYWHFFHDRIHPPGQKLRYRTGLMAFAARPPFEPRRLVREPIRIADPATNPDNYADVEFVRGSVPVGGDVVLSSGVHDRWTELNRFAFNDLNKGLILVE